MKLSIIIVNYNVKYFLETCLHSVLKAVQYIESEILVVDNNSSDDSVAYLAAIFPTVHFIESKENIGFSRANNLALKQAKGEFVVFLNPDTMVAPSTFEHCISFFENNYRKKIGGVGVRMVDGKGSFLPESKRSFPTASTSFYKMMGIEALMPHSKIFGKYSLSFLDEHATHAVEVLSGAFMFFRHSLLKKTGGFDERFFMYGEDIDLSYRANQQGFTNFYLGENPIVHFKGESTKTGTLNYVKMFYGAMLLYVRKHYACKSYIKSKAIETGVMFHSFAALIKVGVGKIFSGKPSLPSENYYFLGDDDSIAEAEKLLMTKNKKGSCLFDYSKAAALRNGVLIMCVGKNFSLLNAISLLTKSSVKLDIMWHHHGANCIVGGHGEKEISWPT